MISSKYHTWCRSTFEPCHVDLARDIKNHSVELSKETSFPVAIVVASQVPSSIQPGALTTLVNHQDLSNTQDSVAHFYAMSMRS
jgi:hypothetical protein